MLVSGIHINRNRDSCELRAQVRCDTQWVWGDGPFEVWYRFPAEYDPFLDANNGDAFIAAFLAPAMVLGESLTVEAPVSPKLMNALPNIQAIYRCFDKRLHEVAFEASVRTPDVLNVQQPRQVGLFFSLGVDSSYSLLKDVRQRSEGPEAATHLINVLGFDIYLWEQERYPRLLENMKRVAQHYRKEVLPVATNLRDFSDRIVDWVLLYHGAALASVGLALGGMYRQIRIAASYTYDRLHPLGSHPLLDPLWATENVVFIHDGCEASRLQKMAFIGQSPILLNTLRVCSASDESDVYNCGCCRKCLMAIAGLYTIGALHLCNSLPQAIDYDAIRQLPAWRPGHRHYCRELIEALSTSDEALMHALEDSLAAGDRMIASRQDVSVEGYL